MAILIRKNRRLQFFKLWVLCLLCALVAAPFGAPLGSNRKPTELEVKAAFLLNFAHFTKWPATALKNKGSPFLITIVGEDPFGPVLDNLMEGEKVEGHPIQIIRVKNLGDMMKKKRDVKIHGFPRHRPIAELVCIKRF